MRQHYVRETRFFHESGTDEPVQVDQKMELFEDRVAQMKHYKTRQENLKSRGYVMTPQPMEPGKGMTVVGHVVAPTSKNQYIVMLEIVMVSITTVKPEDVEHDVSSSLPEESETMSNDGSDYIPPPDEGSRGSSKPADDYVPPDGYEGMGQSKGEFMDGTYTVVSDELPNGYITLKVILETNGKFAGRRIIGFLNGPDNTRNFLNFAFLEPETRTPLRVWKRMEGMPILPHLKQAVDILLADPMEACEAYALKSGKCCRCNRPLTVPTSIHRGLGPECARYAPGGE